MTSQVAKLRLQNYLAGIPLAFSNSSNVSFLIPVRLLVFKSVTTKGSTSLTSAGIGKILLPWKYCAYFYSIFCIVLRWFLFFCAVQKIGIDGTFWAGGMELAGIDDCKDCIEGHFSPGFFEGGLRPSNRSVCDDLLGSSIVAWGN